MSFNGSGVFSISTSGQPVVDGTTISATVFNALTADLATGLSTAILKDGTQTTTARIPFAAGISSTLVTDATSTTTGSIITAGGISTQKALWVGGLANIAGYLTFSANGYSNGADAQVSKSAGSGLTLQGATGTINDFLLVNPGGTLDILKVPTGTTNVFVNSKLGVGLAPTYALDVERSTAGIVARFIGDSSHPYLYITGDSTSMYLSTDTSLATSIGFDETNDAIRVWTGNVQRLTLTTTAFSTTLPFTATGGFKTASGTTASIATATPTTIFSAAAAGRYNVFTYLSNAGSIYCASATVMSDGTNCRITADNGANATLTLSGTNVQVTQTSGVNNIMTYTYTYQSA